MPIKSQHGHFVYPVINKTGNYTITTTDLGCLVTNGGAAGAVTFTLPSAGAEAVGDWVEIAVVADQTVTVQTVVADTLIVFNDIAADSIAWSTASQKVGSGARFTCVSATKWLCTLHPGTTSGAQTAATVTIAT